MTSSSDKKESEEKNQLAKSDAFYNREERISFMGRNFRSFVLNRNSLNDHDVHAESFRQEPTRKKKHTF